MDVREKCEKEWKVVMSDKEDENEEVKKEVLSIITDVEKAIDNLETKEINPSPGIPSPCHTTLYGQIEMHRLRWPNEPQAMYASMNLYDSHGPRGMLNIPVFDLIRIGEKYVVHIALQRITDEEFRIGVTKKMEKKEDG